MKKIDNIGIVGAGSMGAGIAQVAAMAGYTVYLYDQNYIIQKQPCSNF